MKQHICKFWFLLYVAMLSIGMTAQGQLIWTNGPAMTTPRGHHTATVLKDGCPRLQGGQVDMGTYERNTDRYVSLSGAHIYPFTDWITAATNIQAAVDAAVDGDTVWVTNGVYQLGGAATPGYSLSNRVVIAKPIRVQSVNGPDTTFIVGQGPSGAEAVRCAYLTNGAQLCGFTLTNGYTRGVGDINDQCGGGVFLNRGTMVANCVLVGNSVVGDPGRGGGAFSMEFMEGGLLVNCVLEGNSAVRGGGAYGGELRNCVIRGNTAGYGGGVKNALLQNCLVVRNSAWGICGGAKGCDLANCTVSGNSNGGAYEGGGMMNSVVYDNGGYNYMGINGPITYTCTSPLASGEGNLASDPQFVDPAEFDYRLSASSPCVDTGTNQSWMIGEVDLDGRPRLQGGQVDMGAYEQNADLSITPVTRLNTAGHQGGPFNPPAKMYTLINESEDEATWVVVKTQNWLDVSPTGGVLAVGANTNVTVAINRQANTLPVGVYTNLVLFSNVNTAVTQTRKVTLTVFTSPEIYVSSPSLDVTNALSQMTCRALTIGNSGDAPLHYTIHSWQTGYTSLEAPHDVAQSRIEGNSMVLEYAFGKPIVEKRGEYDSIRIEGLRDYLRVGAPILPVRPATLLIPYGKKVTGVRVMVVKGAKLEGLYRLPPAQPPHPLSRPDAVKAVPPDSAIYGKAVPWPGRYHEKLDTQSKRGYQLLTLSLLPLQYTPPTGQIEYVERLRVEVTLADMDAAAVLRVGGQGEPSIASRVDNPQTIGTYPSADRPSRSKTGSVMLPTGGPYQYVIITTPELAASSSPWNFQALCDARTAQGMSATIVTTDWIYAHYSGTRPDGGTDNQTRIRNFLIDAYQTWETRYALLGGVSTLVPARFFWVDSTEMPVDMYYGCVEPATCTFDGDTDGLYGEPTDGVDGGDVDLEAEIYVGRAAVEDATELANFVRKTLTYQQTTLEYLPKITMLGEYLGFGGVSDYATEMMEQIRLGGTYDGYSTYGFENRARPDFVDFNTSNNLYDAPAYDWPKANLIALMNAGTHVFNHLGHANQTYTMKLNNWDLSSLTNTDYFFVYSQGCMPGWFDSPDCFAEEITAMEHGAFAVVMNARYGWGRFDSTDGPSERFDRQYWDAVLGENMLELGRANQDSKEDNLWDINGSCIRWCYYELNLFGDPAQRFRFVDSAEWITTTPESGTVSPGASTNIEACFDAGELNPGVYQGEIALASDDLDTPSINMPCAMTVLPDDLRLSPSSDFSASGCQGGPFSPSNMVYQLTNMGRSNLTWTATCSSNWISLTPSGGTLAAGASEVITVRISSIANRLPVGVYGDRLTFSNDNNGVIQCRSVLLDVIPVPPTIVTIDFDEGFTTGAQTQDFLSAYGISSVTFSGAPGAMGPWIIDGTVGNTIPSSEPNALMQWLSATDPGQIHRLTFLFSPELKEFSLTRAGRFGGSSTDTWIARFFNSSNVELGSFGESTLLVDQPPKKFTFTAPSGETISRMDLESVYRAATTATVPVDDFVLVSKAAQTINFPNPGPQSVTNQLGLSATASSGLPVSFAVESGPGTLADRTNLTFTGIGTVVIVASQAGDENWNPAPNVTNSIPVTRDDNDGVVNLALASRGSAITGSNGANWSNLIDGVTTGYTGDTGYGYTIWNTTPAGTMTLDMKGTCTITRTKLLLWDLDSRYYRYKIEASIDNKTWTLIVDRTSGECRSWQDIGFSPAIQARYLRLTGTYNSVPGNNGFHVVEWEVYGRPPTLAILTSADAVTVPEGSNATFQVKLNTAPVSPTAVTVSRVSGDADIVVQSDNSLEFDASNWSTYQTVTLSAADDADEVNGSATIRCSAPGITDKDVTATEQDNDGVVNLALASRGSAITGSNGANWSNLIDGVTTGYTGDTGYGYTIWNTTPAGTMTLDMKGTCTITRTKLLLWDLDSRYYRYKIEASIDNKTWTLIVDRTSGECRSWQDIGFSPAIQARYLRLTGTYNSVPGNNGFHVVEWEVYGRPPTLAILTSADAVTVPEGSNATFQIKLNTAPVSPTAVTVSRVSGDADIVVQSDNSLEFDASNWSTYQTVTLSAADDADEVNGSATIRCSAPGITDKDVTATEQDNDGVVNLALASRGSAITGSNGANWSNLIDGVTTGYTGDTGYGYTIWNTTPAGTMTLDMKGTCTITRTKLLLWDLDSRYYRYKIEASIDNKTWTLIVDRTSGECRSWQDIGFSPAIQARYLRLTGTYNSVPGNNGFHVVEWEVYGRPPTLAILTSADAVTVPEGSNATFQVKLNTAPVSPTAVTVSRVSGDADIVVQSDNSLEFDASNWSTYQTVTLSAADDADEVNGSATIRCSAPGITDKDVTATEQDNDGVVNLALASRGSAITGSNGANWSNLIDGVTTGYTGDTGYGYTIWNTTPAGTMTLDMKGTCTITRTKLLLWDLDSRYYRYKIEASIDNKTWTLIVDRTSGECRSWQDIGFSPAIQARYLRLTGTYNSVPGNNGFHVVEWEVYGRPPTLAILTSADAVTVPEGSNATFQIKLNTAPVSPTAVTVSRVSGDADIVVQSDNSLEFDASNWSTYQTVTLSAADDADEVNGSATIRCSAPGITDKDVTATEQDNDGVVPPNNLPIALSQTLGLSNDTITALTLMADDQEGDNLSYRITSGPAHGTLDTNEAPNVMYTPNPGYVGSDEFRFVASDGKLDSNEAIITLNVTSNSVLDIAYQQKLNRYAAATVRYFTSAQANNTNTAFTHSFYGIGPYQMKDVNGTWRTNDLLPRGYGSHVNMNEVTIRFLSLATAYKMNWLDHIAPTQRYARSWGAILTGLQTIHSMQTSDNINQYCSNTFHRMYLTTTYHNAPDQDRTVAEIACDPNVNEQSSDDNALPFVNLLLLQGLANDPAVTAIVDRVAITNLCRQIRDAIDLRRFLVDNRVVMNYVNGLPNTNAIWNRVSVEGSLILGAMLLQGQIGTNKSYGIDTNEFYATAPSLVNHPVWWSNRLSDATTYVGKPSYHAAIYAHGLRAMHGMPVTAAEFTTNVNFFVTSLKPVTETQIDYADGYDLKALGSQVMSQSLRGVPVFERNGVQVQFPGNENNLWPDPSNDLAIATGPHAWFVPLQRWRYLAQLDYDDIFTWVGEYETNFFHVAGDPDIQLGWEAAVPFRPDDTRYAWRASDGSWRYTDWGRPYEALNAGYTVLSIFDALNPDKPLSDYNIEAMRWGYIAQYLDSNVRLPAVLFPR